MCVRERICEEIGVCGCVRESGRMSVCGVRVYVSGEHLYACACEGVSVCGSSPWAYRTVSGRGGVCPALHGGAPLAHPLPCGSPVPLQGALQPDCERGVCFSNPTLFKLSPTCSNRKPC